MFQKLDLYGDCGVALNFRMARNSLGIAPIPIPVSVPIPIVEYITYTPKNMWRYSCDYMNMKTLLNCVCTAVKLLEIVWSIIVRLTTQYQWILYSSKYLHPIGSVKKKKKRKVLWWYLCIPWFWSKAVERRPKKAIMSTARTIMWSECQLLHFQPFDVVVTMRFWG